MSNSILFFISSLSTGGAEKVLAQLANTYSKRGLEVTVLTYYNMVSKSNSLSAGINYICLPFPKSRFRRNPLQWIVERFIFMYRVRICIKKLSPDVVLSFMLTSNIIMIISSLFMGVRGVVSERTNPRYYSYGKVADGLRPLIYKLADSVVVQTEDVFKYLNNYSLIKISIIPNFVSSFSFPVINYNNFKIVTVGRLVHLKGFDVLLKAFASICNYFPSWSVIVIGEGEERASLEYLIKQYNLNDKFILHGYCEEPYDLIAQASIVVQPSRVEGFPNALLEAMSFGLAPIATFEAGNMLIRDGVNGLLVKSDDVDELANALISVMENAQGRKNLGQAALGVRETFSKEYVMKQWDKVLFPSLQIKD